MSESIAHLVDPELRGLTRANVFGLRDHLAKHYAYWFKSIPIDELYSAGNLAIAETLAAAPADLTPTQLAALLYHAIRHAILAVWHEEHARQHPPFAAVNVERVTTRRVRHAA